MRRWGLAVLAVLCAACAAERQPTYRELEGMARDYESGGTSPLAAPPNADEATRRDTCGARRFRDRIGQPVSAVEVPYGARVIGPETAVTDDFRPARLNIITDASGVITALQCY